MNVLPHPFRPLFPLSSVFGYWNHCSPARLCTALVQRVEPCREEPFIYRPSRKAGRVAYTLVLRGSATLTGGPEHGCVVGPGDLLRLDGRSGFRVDTKLPWEECSVAVDGRTVQALNTLGLLHNPIVICPGGDATLVTAFEAMIDSLSGTRDSYAQQAQLVYWATNLNKHLDRHSPRSSVVEKAKHWFTMHLNTRPTIAEAADELGLSESHLRRLFRQEFGQSIGHWQIAQRIERAQTLLAEHSIEEVSRALGYADRYAFSRQFKQHTGSSPGRWCAD